LIGEEVPYNGRRIKNAVAEEGIVVENGFWKGEKKLQVKTKNSVFLSYTNKNNQRSIKFLKLSLPGCKLLPRQEEPEIF
jgi:hypothetical protein